MGGGFCNKVIVFLHVHTSVLLPRFCISRPNFACMKRAVPREPVTVPVPCYGSVLFFFLGGAGANSHSAAGRASLDAAGWRQPHPENLRALRQNSHRDLLSPLPTSTTT